METVSEIPDYNTFFPWASGNQTTCRFQGFLFQLGTLSSILFSGSIAIHIQTVLTVTVGYRWTELRLRRLEKVCFAFGILFPLFAAIFVVVTDMLHVNSAGVCWINQYPWVCDFDDEPRHDETMSTWCKDHPDLVDTDIASFYCTRIFLVSIGHSWY